MQHHVTSHDLWSKPKQGITVLQKNYAHPFKPLKQWETQGGEWLSKGDSEQEGVRGDLARTDDDWQEWKFEQLVQALQSGL